MSAAQDKALLDFVQNHLDDLSLDDVYRELARRSLYEYIKQSWTTVEPGYVYRDNWHIGAICEHLQAVSEGQIKRLIVNMPPRHMKSLIISVAWPTWEWITRPHRKFLFASYAQALSTRDAVKSRRLINSPWYQKNFGNTFQLTGDQNQKQRYENDKTGYRIATSVGGQLTGDGGDFVAIDDPHNMVEAESEAVREQVLEWWDQAVPTRLNDPENGAFIIIMQRVHEKDLTGHILAKEQGWDHLVLPARYERKPLHPIQSSLGFADPRKQEGELLWPERFTPKVMEGLERSLGEYGSSSQLQQRPAPAGGGLIKTKHFRLWASDRRLPRFDFIVQSYDTAFTDNTKNDPTANSTWGVFTPDPTPDDPEPLACALLLDAWDEHLAYPQLRTKMKTEYRSVFGSDDNGRRPDLVLIEEKGSGIALVRDLAADRLPIARYNPGRADKTSRVQQSLPLLESGRFYIPESGKNRGEPVSWAKPFLKQLGSFPVAEHDDYVDTWTQFTIYMRDTGWIVLKDRLERDPDENPDDDDVPRKKGNPYAA